MNISISDPTLRTELLAFLRERGCIANVGVMGEITALIPELAALEEARAIARLAEQWRLVHPPVELEVTRSILQLEAVR
jgi:hypothetical protein